MSDNFDAVALANEIKNDNDFNDIVNTLCAENNDKDLHVANNFKNFFDAMMQFSSLINEKYQVNQLSRIDMQTILKNLIDNDKAYQCAEIYNFGNKLQILKSALNEKNTHPFLLVDLYAEILATLKDFDCRLVIGNMFDEDQQDLWFCVKEKLLTITIDNGEIEDDLSFKINKSFNHILFAIINIENNPIDIIFALDSFDELIKQQYKTYKKDDDAQIDAIFRNFILNALIENSDKITLSENGKNQLEAMTEGLSASYPQIFKKKKNTLKKLKPLQQKKEELFNQINRLILCQQSSKILNPLTIKFVECESKIREYQAEHKQYQTLDNFFNDKKFKNRKNLAPYKATFGSLPNLLSTINLELVKSESQKEDVKFIKENIEPTISYLNIKLGISKYQNRKAFEKWAFDVISGVCHYFIRNGIAENLKHDQHDFAHRILNTTKQCLLDLNTPVIDHYAKIINLLRCNEKNKGDLFRVINNDLLPPVKEIIPIIEKPHSDTYQALQQYEMSKQLDDEKVIKEKDRINKKIKKTPEHVINQHRKQYLAKKLSPDQLQKIYGENKNNIELKIDSLQDNYFNNKLNNIYEKFKQWFRSILYPNEIVKELKKKGIESQTYYFNRKTSQKLIGLKQKTQIDLFKQRLKL